MLGSVLERERLYGFYDMVSPNSTDGLVSVYGVRMRFQQNKTLTNLQVSDIIVI